jgi:uncharacterized membrane protein
VIRQEEWAGPGPALVWLTVAMSIAGLGVAAYLTAAHYSDNALLVCSATGTVDCAKVTTSPESRLLGAPVALLGLAWFVPMLGLSLPAAWRRASLVLIRIAWVVGGIGFVVWLIYAELFRIGAICLWCSVVHLTVFVLFTAVLAAGVPELRR